MEGVYRAFVREAGNLDLSRAATFNLDEYLGLAPGDPRTFRAYMTEHLFDHLGFTPERCHVPDPELARADLQAYCEGYERAIQEAGGLELQLLGLGRNGHIAFNEPGASRDSRTRRVELNEVTREDAVGTFGSVDDVPRAAITMGVATILEAKRIRVLAFGAGKAEVLRRALTDPVGPELPATYLRGHQGLEFWVDEAAATGLDGLPGDTVSDIVRD